MVSDTQLSWPATSETGSLNPCSNGIWSLTRSPSRRRTGSAVLILVLMEYGLWPDNRLHNGAELTVLILVLMEYGLWHGGDLLTTGDDQVLILVLMEYGLWPGNVSQQTITMGLNPCSNGIWSLTLSGQLLPFFLCSLNPCSNGIWSLTPTLMYSGMSITVLILVLMEYGLWQNILSSISLFLIES